MTTTPADWRTPWRSMRWVFVAVWLLFLGYPIGAIVGSDHSVGWKVLGLGLIGVFAVIYLLTAVYLLADAIGPDLRGLIAFVVLAALIGGLAALIGQGAWSLSPYLMVVAAFTFSGIWATVTVAGTVLMALILSGVGSGLDLSVVAIIAAVGTTMLALRVLRVRETERERANELQRETDGRLAVVAERERVARDVHDILGHSLTVITLKSELAGRLVDLDPERAKSELAELHTLARDALSEVRSTVGALRTPDLAETIASARSALSAAGIEAVLPDPNDTHAAPVLAWVLREAVTNVVRHSEASRCEVDLTVHSITVRDNGHGMNDQGFGNGLRGLVERVDAAGGSFDVDSGGQGTTVRAVLR